MPLTNNGRAAALAGLAVAVTHVAIHTAIPNSAGSAELAGGAYARVPVAWTQAGGVLANDGSLAHNIPAGGVAAAYGFWSALAGGTFHGWAPINGDTDGVGVTDAAADTITSPAHTLTNGDRVHVRAVVGQALPGGLTVDVLYHVVAATTDAFKVSTTGGGAAVDLAGAGEVYYQLAVPEVFGQSGVLTTDTGDLFIDMNGL